MKLKISIKNVLYCQIIYNCIIKFFIVDLHFPSALNYGSDVLLILAFFMVLRKNHFLLNRQSIKLPMLFAGVLLLISTISAFLEGEFYPVLFLWSFRNNYRIFVFFYCCCEVLEKEDIYKIFEILEKILYVNIILCIYEYFVCGVEYDFLGGLYGNGIQGGNGPLNALMIIVCTYIIVEYINKNKSIWRLLLCVGGCIFIATVGELKFFYFEIVLLVILVCIFVTHNIKMCVFVTAIAVIGLIGMRILVQLYPQREGFLNLAYILYYSRDNSYGASTDINRLTAINVISERYFNSDLKKILFGLGIGNGEFSSTFDFLNSDFYSSYSGRLRYDWFSHAFMFVEAGYIGLILYILSFVSAMVKGWMERKNNMMNQISMIAMVFIIMMIFYNQVLRMESVCYMAAFIMSIPYINEKNGNEQELRINA